MILFVRARAHTHTHTRCRALLDLTGYDDVSPQEGWMAGLGKGMVVVVVVGGWVWVGGGRGRGARRAKWICLFSLLSLLAPPSITL